MSNKHKILIVFICFVFLLVCLYASTFHKKTAFRPPRYVLLITIDSLRADHLGCHGYLKNTTPNIDRLAQDGILFTQAISTGTWTIPSIPSILTSLYQPHHGIFSYGDTLNNKAVSLAEVLSKKAYRTAFMGPRFFSEIKGIERGFDYFNNKQENAKADKLTDKVIEWIKGHKKERFFLWLHYFDPHAPYRPPAPYNSMFISNVAANEKPVVNTNPEYAGIPNYALLEGNHGLDYYIAQYDGTIRFVDDQIGRLLNSLKESMIYNDTLIIITADHGELLGEHGIYFVHGGLPLDAVIKIPLIMHYNKYSKGLIIDCQVSLIDLAPTILEILKLEKPAVMIGNSLLYLTRNFQRCPEGISYVGNELMSAVRTPEWKLVHIDYKDLTMFIEEHSKNYEDESYKYLSFDLKRLFSDKSEYVLLNLKQDPEELKIFSGKERFDFLKKKLDAWSRTFPPIQKSKADIPHLDAETKEYLRSLGYVQ